MAALCQPGSPDTAAAPGGHAVPPRAPYAGVGPGLRRPGRGCTAWSGPEPESVCEEDSRRRTGFYQAWPCVCIRADRDVPVQGLGRLHFLCVDQAPGTGAGRRRTLAQAPRDRGDSASTSAEWASASRDEGSWIQCLSKARRKMRPSRSTGSRPRRACSPRLVHASALLMSQPGALIRVGRVLSVQCTRLLRTRATGRDSSEAERHRTVLLLGNKMQSGHGSCVRGRS
jgi:hypothetical protein